MFYFELHLFIQDMCKPVIGKLAFLTQAPLQASRDSHEVCACSIKTRESRNRKKQSEDMVVESQFTLTQFSSRRLGIGHTLWSE